MKVSRKLFAITATVSLLTLLAIPNRAASERLTSLSANARGQGTLKVGREVFKVHSLVVQLKADGTGEIMVVTDITVFVHCTWSAGEDLSKGVDLKITGGTTASGAEGSGKLLLRADGKSIASLSFQAARNVSKRKVELNFVAE